MSDLKIRWDDSLFEGDFLFENNDFTTDDGLGTAVMISWFSDQLAADDDPIPNQVDGFIDKRGWWGDQVDPIVDNDEIGSKLWLLSRAKTTQENITKAINYGTDALQWMIQDGIVKDITVEGEKLKYNNDYILALSARITKQDGNVLNITFDNEWFITLDEEYN